MDNLRQIRFTGITGALKRKGRGAKVLQKLSQMLSKQPETGDI